LQALLLNVRTLSLSLQRSKAVDFSYQQDFFGTYIFSIQKSDQILGNTFSGIFDNKSYLLCLIAMVLMTIMAWITIPGNTLVHAILSVWGNSLNQPLYSSVKSTSAIAQTMLCAFALYNYSISTMYNSVIISKLTAHVEARAINSLEDLLRPENEHLRILVENTFVPEQLRSLSLYDRIKNRVYIFEQSSMGEFYQKTYEAVLNGTHVTVETRDNLFYNVCLVRIIRYCSVTSSI
jgi:hypothetical protein